MGGNTFSKEHDSKKPTSADAAAVHGKSAKEPKPEEKEDSKKGVEKTSVQVTGHQEIISKAKSKEGSKSSKQSSKKSSPDEETKDVFARIVAGEMTSSPVANAPANAVVVGGNSPAAHGHVVQHGTFRYSPAFEAIRKTFAANISERQQQQQEQQGKQKLKKSADKMPTTRMAIPKVKSSEEIQKKLKEVSKNEKSHSKKQKSNKSSVVSKESKSTSSLGKSEPKNKQGHVKSKQSSKASFNGSGSNKSKTFTTNLEANINAKPKKPSSKDT